MKTPCNPSKEPMRGDQYLRRFDGDGDIITIDL